MKVKKIQIGYKEIVLQVQSLLMVLDLFQIGMFTWPIPGYTTITSPFGMRTHPITGAYKLHSGTDVRCTNAEQIL